MLSETIVISTHAVVIVFTQFWVFTKVNNDGNFISNLYEHINHIDLIFSRLNYIYINTYCIHIVYIVIGGVTRYTDGSCYISYFHF